jgi:hypothetical protein
MTNQPSSVQSGDPQFPICVNPMETELLKYNGIVPLCEFIRKHKIIIYTINSESMAYLPLIFLGIMPGFYFEHQLI